MRTPSPLLALALAAPLPAQTLDIVVREGDTVPGVGTIISVLGVAVADDGSTLIEVDTDNANTAADSCILLNGVLVLREDQPLTDPVGALLGGFDGSSIAASGATIYNVFLDGTPASGEDSGIYRGDQLVIQEGDVSTASAFSAGTPYIGFFDVKWGGDDSKALVVASIDDPNIASTVDRALVRLDFDAAGNLVGETVIAKEGDLLPGQTEPVADFETGAEESAMNAAGQVIFTADLAGDTTVDRAIYLDATLLMQEGSPSPVAGRNWGSLSSVEVDLNASGSWVAKANLDNTDTATDDVIVVDGSIFRRAGDTLPAIAPFTFTDFGGSVGTWITDSGDVVWFGDWDDADTSRDEGLFINDELVLQEGVTVVDGETIIDLSDITEQVHVSPSGEFILIEGEFNDGTADRDAIIRIDLRLGTPYCTAELNDTGLPGLLSASGSALVADGDVTLRASQLPPNQFGIFVTSQVQDFVPAGAFSNGNVCLGSPIGRFNGPGQILTSGGAGAFELALDLNQIPQGVGFVAVLPGETWNYQAWHREFGGVGSNFTGALSITYE